MYLKLRYVNAYEYYDDGVNYRFLDNMPFSKNKLSLINASAPADERFSLARRFVKYHSRWNELRKTDFTYNKKENVLFS